MVTRLPLPNVIRLIAWLILGLATAGEKVRAAEVTATLNRETVPAGEGALLTVTINGGKAERPDVPEIPDFIVQPRGQESSFQFSNGVRSSTVSYTYVVGAHTPGDYVIPPFPVTVDGSELRTPELRLKVLSAGQASPPPSPPAAGQAPPAAASNSPGSLRLEFETSGRPFSWVGEIVPIKIKATFSNDSGLQQAGRPQPEGSGFTLQNLSEQPDRNVEIIGGKRCLVLTWHAGLSATKEGTITPEFTMGAVVAVRSRGGSTGDPFFDSFFGRSTPKEIKLSSKDSGEISREIRALPEEGRPEGFSGAVGAFHIDAFGGPSGWKTGEPEEVTVTVSGAGNFALLTQPEPLPAEAWKSYPGGDGDFTAQDRASFRGSQLFRFNIVPQKSGTQKLSFAIPYFNPKSGQYETAAYSTKEFEVSGADVPAAVASTAAGEKPPTPATPPDPDQLAPQHMEDTGTVSSLTPPAWRSGFAAVCASGGGLAVLGLALGTWRRFRTDPERLARAAFRQNLAAALTDARTFSGRGDAVGFFAAGRRALQLRLAENWACPPHGISLGDVSGRLGAESPAAIFFREADRREFAGGPGSSVLAPALSEWFSRLEAAMASLEPETPTRSPRSRSAAAAVVKTVGALLFLTWIQNSGAADLTQGNADFAAGRFAEAAEKYETALRQNGASAAGLYNLGNARYRAGQVGEAILAWERAALLMPRDPDLRSNLAIARRKSALSGEVPELSWAEQITSRASLREWSWILAGSSLLTGVLVLAQGIFGFRRSATAGVTVCVLTAALSGAALRFREPELKRAILTAKSPVLRVSPLATADTTASPGEGRTVLLEEQRDGWAKVRLPGGSTSGWIPSGEVERVIPES